MRFRLRLCASPDWGVRRSKVSSSFCSAGYMGILQNAQAECWPLDWYTAGGEPRYRGSSRFYSILEEEFQGELQQPRLFGSQDATKIATVCDVAVRIVELRVIKEIEKFGAKFNPGSFGNGRDFMQGKVKIVDGRTATDGPLGVPDAAEGRVFRV